MIVVGCFASNLFAVDFQVACCHIIPIIAEDLYSSCRIAIMVCRH